MTTMTGWRVLRKSGQTIPPEKVGAINQYKRSDLILVPLPLLSLVFTVLVLVLPFPLFSLCNRICLCANRGGGEGGDLENLPAKIPVRAGDKKAQTTTKFIGCRGL